jgi:myo-inositol catabolism protein IolC
VTPLYMLAFDHRSSFSRDLLGFPGEPTPEEAVRVSDAKLVVYEGFQAALANGVEARTAGLLVDEQFGAGIARSARAAGVALAMPVERSGQAEFELEFGDSFGAHIEDFDPRYAKVLVRYNPCGDAAANRRQAERLRELSEWLRERDRGLLFELLVPPTEAQRELVHEDPARYDRELRPMLVVSAIRELQEAGVEPALWKIEGLDSRDDCAAVVEQARAGGRSASCIVLGRGADEERVAGWLCTAAAVPGFAGFAVGRTLWWNELVAYVAGDLDRASAAVRIGANYSRMVETFTRCAW